MAGLGPLQLHSSDVQQYIFMMIHIYQSPSNADIYSILFHRETVFPNLLARSEKYEDRMLHGNVPKGTCVNMRSRQCATMDVFHVLFSSRLLSEYLHELNYEQVVILMLLGGTNPKNCIVNIYIFADQCSICVHRMESTGSIQQCVSSVPERNTTFMWSEGPTHRG